MSPPDVPDHPPAAVLKRSIRPSLVRAFASVLSVFAIPLLLLAAISSAKMLAAAGLITVGETLSRIIAIQSQILGEVSEWLLPLGIRLPPWLFDVAFVYIFVGNATARAEGDDLMSIEYPAGERWALFKEGVRKARSDLLLISLPWLLRQVVVRVGWPLVTAYRLGTPYVVEGPGPTGETISTSVPRSDLDRFVAMVKEAGEWEDQEIVDQRQVLFWQIVIGAGSALALNLGLKLAAFLM